MKDWFTQCYDCSRNYKESQGILYSLKSSDKKSILYVCISLIIGVYFLPFTYIQCLRGYFAPSRHIPIGKSSMWISSLPL